MIFFRIDVMDLQLRGFKIKEKELKAQSSKLKGKLQ
jgi:hypothetical protein